MCLTGYRCERKGVPRARRPFCQGGSSISPFTTAVDILLEHWVAMAVCCPAMCLDYCTCWIPSLGVGWGESEAVDLRMVRFSCLSSAFCPESTVVQKDLVPYIVLFCFFLLEGQWLLLICWAISSAPRLNFFKENNFQSKYKVTSEQWS